MTLWRLEWLRLIRTKRWIALVGVFVFFGLLGPLTARYLGEIIDFAGGELEGATIEFPPPVPADGMTQFVSNAMQIGTLEAVGLGWQKMDEYLPRIQAVTAEQVQAVARKYLIDDHLTVAVLDPQPMDDETRAAARAAAMGAGHGH